MEKRTVKVMKVPLEDLIEILNDLYDRGANFIDLVATVANEEGQPTINNLGIFVKSEYFEEYDDEEDLSEDDLNQLIE